MPMKQYTVQAPDGKTITLEGPEGATDEEVIAQAQRLYQPGQSSTPRPAAPAVAAPTFSEKLYGTSKALATAIAPDFGGQAVDVGIGGLKGIGSTAQNILSMIPGVRSLMPQQSPEFLTPQNPAQKTGFYGEQVAEFAVPSSMAETAVTKAAPMLGQIGKYMPTVARAGAQALTAGAVTGAQGGTVGDVAKNAAIGGAVPIIGKAVEPMANVAKSYLSEKVAPRIVDSLIKPLAKHLSFGRDPGRAITQEGITATSMDDLFAKTNAVRQTVGKELEQALQSAPSGTVINAEAGIKPIVNAEKLKAIKGGDQAMLDRINQIERGITKTFKEVNGDIVETGTRDLTNMTPLQATELKREIGEATQWTGQAYDKQVNQLRVKLYHLLDNAVDQAVPATKDLNSRYSNLLGATKSIEYRQHVMQRLNMLGLNEVLAGLAAGAVDAVATGHISPEALMLGGLGAGVMKAARSTPAVTQVAKQLGQLSPQERTIFARQVVPILRDVYFATSENRQ